MITITCHVCGHVGDLEAFSTSPAGIELPHDTIQCPGCGLAVRRELETRRRLDWDGEHLVWRAPVRLVPVGATL